MTNYNLPGDSLYENDLVSCLCVTRGRVPMLRRAVACFLDQTYAPRELVVVYESDDAATRDFLATLNEPAIRALEVPVQPKLPLGSLRNLSLAAARGRYVAQWDDDDWHGPARLAAQIAAVRESGKDGCVLIRWLMYDETRGMAYLSHLRAWEGSLVALRDAIPPYPEHAKGEDTPVVAAMLNENRLTGLDRPRLYIYVYHGSNTWEREHWETRLAPFAQPLTAEQAELVRQRLYGAGMQPQCVTASE